MKHTALAAIVAVAFGATFAGAQSGNPTQQAATPARTGAAAITVVGCVLPDEGGAAEATGTTGITGSRANSTYVLTNVTVGNATAVTGARAQSGAGAGPPAAREGQTGAAQAGSGTRATAQPSAHYTLEGHDMTPYAAQQVEVTGTVAPETSGPRTAPNAGPGAKPGEPAAQWIHVTNVRRIAAVCPVQP